MFRTDQHVSGQCSWSRLLCRGSSAPCLEVIESRDWSDFNQSKSTNLKITFWESKYIFQGPKTSIFEVSIELLFRTQNYGAFLKCITLFDFHQHLHDTRAGQIFLIHATISPQIDFTPRNLFLPKLFKSIAISRSTNQNKNGGVLWKFGHFCLLTK